MNSSNIQSLFKASPISQLVLKPDAPVFTITEVNDAYLEATNTKYEDLIGKSIFDAFPGNPHEPGGQAGIKNLRASLNKVLSLKQPDKLDTIKYDIPIRGTSDFEIRYWIAHNHPVLTHDGVVDFIIHAPVDVTRIILAEQKMEESSRELHIIQQQLLKEKNLAETLINSLPGTFFLFDENKLYRWNKNLEVLTGYTSKELSKLHPLALIPDEHIEIALKSLEEIHSKGKAEVEGQLLLKNGQTMPFHFSSSYIILDNKRYILGIGFDLTDLQKERNERIRLSEILEKSRNEIFITDERTRHFIYVNAEARDNLGYSMEELKQMTPMDIIVEDYIPQVKSMVKLLEDGVKDRVVFNTVHRRANGSLYNVEVHLQLVEQDDYRVFVAIMLDTTERVRAEGQLKSSLKEKEVLLNEVHHRVKNNLAIVSSLLKMQVANSKNETLKELLSESEGRIHAMAMIHEILYQHDDFSRIDFGHYIQKLLTQVKMNYARPGKNIQTEVIADPVFLELSTAVPCALIVNELLTNACKHAFNGRTEGEVKITLKKTPNMYTLIFSDNGVGLPLNYNTDSLGLSLIHGLTHQIGGTVDISRENGTTFTITFPMR